MPTATGKPVNLASIANYHSKNATKKRSNNALRAKLADFSAFRSDPVYQNSFSKSESSKKNCGPKPPQFTGTKKNPAYNAWKACSSPAAGGTRNTRKGKKSTHRRR